MVRLLRCSDLKTLKGIPFSRMHINRLEKVGSFPKRIHLSAMTVGWVEEEIDAYIAAKMAQREREVA